MVVTGNGHRTLIYPAVGNSAVRHQAHSNLSALNNGSAGRVQHVGNSHSASKVATVAKTKLDPQTSARLRHWNGNVSSRAQAQLNNVNQRHNHHDHDWWRRHCLTIIFFDWGWWGWYDGWWYPAWGYDDYSHYEYNQPIYGDIAPDQIVAGVQAKLQQLGYYNYAIDGKMGPLTQSAIANYQRDHHMNITSGVDPAILNSLGIIR
ncbi:MAG: peptidoglycan-binding protein [Verrucomicrobia bacterium]|nr:peptidoglycan-binding protein [Verrucomicrobiota bacterium]